MKPEYPATCRMCGGLYDGAVGCLHCAGERSAPAPESAVDAVKLTSLPDFKATTEATLAKMRANPLPRKVPE